jgi:ABC-type transport system involved in multi-copper enzyme maturation permease subunit
MQALLAIARLTFKAAFRFRLVPVLAVLLLGAVVALPEVLEHDGTARGLAQIVLTYTLGLTTALLGMTTLWLACGTLARDIEECQMQVVAVKPVARWQVWVGKWLGIMALNALLLSLAAGIVYVELLWRARGLPPVQQEVLRSEVLVARGSSKPSVPDLEPLVEQVMQERLKNERVAAMDRTEVRKIIREQVKSQEQVVPPGYQREWRLELGAVKESMRGQPMFLRIKFFVADRSTSGTYLGIWQVGPPNTAKRWTDARSQAAETFHEFAIPPNMFDEQGVLTVTFQNQNETALLFPLEDGLEVLYPEGGFGLNYLRGAGIIFCWLALLAAVGLAAASFLSFPVAAFFSLGVLIVAFSTGTMNQVIEQGTIRQVNPNTGEVDQAVWFDHATVAVFKGMLFAVNLVRDFSPIDLLSTGRSITWGQLARAVAQIILLIGGVFALIGVTAFTRRELATAQGVT